MKKQETTYFELTALGLLSLVIGVLAGAVDTFSSSTSGTGD